MEFQGSAHLRRHRRSPARRRVDPRRQRQPLRQHYHRRCRRLRRRLRTHTVGLPAQSERVLNADKETEQHDNQALAIIAIALLLGSQASAAPKYKVLHAFAGGKDGGDLESSLLLDKQGNAYGTAINNAFELTPHTNGRWSLKVLHTFGDGDDGSGPWGGLIFDPEGDLYG